MTADTVQRLFYTVDEAAVILGMGRSTLYRRTSDRDQYGRRQTPLPHHNIRGRRFTQGDIDAILALTARGGNR